MKLNNMLASFLIFAALIGLLVSAYNGFDSTYSLHQNGENAAGENIMEALDNINFIAGINQSVTAIYKIVNPSNVFDVVGGLLTGGIGAVRTVLGFVSIVPEVLLVVTNFYTGLIPPILSQIIGILFSVYAGMVLLYYITGRGQG